MPTDDPDPKRRRFLTAATSVVGGAGLVAVAWPFVSSMQPSAQARAAGAPVEISIAKVEPGMLIRQEWRGKPIWVVGRSEQILKNLSKLDSQLRDPHSTVTSQQPAFAQNEYRSMKPEYLVLIGICTHLGCSPTFRPEIAPPDLGPKWLGGFFCPCHGSRYDLAGRVYNNMPAPLNLEVPPYKYLNNTRILVGVLPGKEAA
ncbi:MAG TPA: ubiquinol-cytochrome c reductase iron-sulfur subunit [Gammaproteobacteria bacterium]|jgi:ubiquinol-cytochrome c reductase iron-sulfur subunit|nr:ubiquinol-cytochrome c reductase iron-sulfur subunit [Gammaproteobacteria bacterium]